MPSLPQGKIVFGDRVTNLSEWKFTAMFSRGSRHAFCTGAIIDEIHILSAAHCLVYIDDEYGQKEARYCIVLYWIGFYGIVSCCFVLHIIELFGSSVMFKCMAMVEILFRVTTQTRNQNP